MPDFMYKEKFIDTPVYTSISSIELQLLLRVKKLVENGCNVPYLGAFV